MWAFTRAKNSLQWESIREGCHVKLKTRCGNQLRANGGVPPWWNSVTHNIPIRIETEDWVLREVVAEIQMDSPVRSQQKADSQSNLQANKDTSGSTSSQISLQNYLNWSFVTVMNLGLVSVSVFGRTSRHRQSDSFGQISHRFQISSLSSS